MSRPNRAGDFCGSLNTQGYAALHPGLSQDGLSGLTALNTMRECRVILGVLGLILVGILVLGLITIDSRQWAHRRFLGRDQSYYAQVADACESLRKTRTFANDEYVTMSGSEESIPKVIRDLHPGKIIISQAGVSILVGQGRPDFGITWRQDDAYGTNQWTLSIGNEGGSKVVYRMAF